jgi:hypothetical protein
MEQDGLRSGVIVSAVVHGAIVLGAFVSLASPKPFAPAPVDWMTVDLVTPGDLADADKAGAPAPAAPQQGAAPPQAASSQPSTEQAVQNPPAQPQNQAAPQPQTKVAQPQTPAAQPQVLPRPEPPQTPAPQQAAAAPTAPEATPPPADAIQEGASFETLSATAMLESPLNHPGEGFEQIDNPADISSDVMKRLQARVQQCWSLSGEVPDAPKLTVQMRVRFKPNGALLGQPVLMAAPASEAGPALVQSAMRALQQCQPYGILPADKYKEWKALDLSFTPRGLTLGPRGLNFTPGPGG